MLIFTLFACLKGCNVYRVRNVNYKIPEVLAGGPLGLIDFVLQAFVVPHVVVFEKYFKKRSTSDFS